MPINIVVVVAAVGFVCVVSKCSLFSGYHHSACPTSSGALHFALYVYQHVNVLTILILFYASCRYLTQSRLGLSGRGTPTHKVQSLTVFALHLGHYWRRIERTRAKNGEPESCARSERYSPETENPTM